MSYEEAACLLYTGLTTWCALTSAGGLNASNAADKNVLVIGGSGGVGNCAIQILKSWGSKVLYRLVKINTALHVAIWLNKYYIFTICDMCTRFWQAYRLISITD